MGSQVHVYEKLSEHAGVKQLCSLRCSRLPSTYDAGLVVLALRGRSGMQCKAAAHLPLEPLPLVVDCADDWAGAGPRGWLLGGGGSSARRWRASTSARNRLHSSVDSVLPCRNANRVTARGISAFRRSAVQAATPAHCIEPQQADPAQLDVIRCSIVDHQHQRYPVTAHRRGAQQCTC